MPVTMIVCMAMIAAMRMRVVGMIMVLMTVVVVAAQF